MKTKHKLNKGKWIIIAIVTALTFGVLTISGLASNDKGTFVKYTELYPAELIDSINIKGVVESAEKNNIYSYIGFTVKKVYVEVGDSVTEGQILCVLDTDELENNIAQQKAQLYSSEQNIKTQIQIANLNLESAQKKYNDAFKDTGNDLILNLAQKKIAFENNKELFERGYISENDLSQSEFAYTNALNNYNTTLEQTSDNLRTAVINYDNAMAANTDTLKFTIKNLEKQLRDSLIRAPASGTVTAVYAKEGIPGSGLLFVLEDTGNLVIKATIKEYDISKAQVGMKAIIKSDSTESAAYEGVVTKIAPAAVKDLNGETVLKSSDIEFEAQITFLSKETDLRIGMNTRLNIILGQKDQVYFIPYDTLITEANGESYIFVISENDQHRQTAKQINVTTGMETDFYVEITGADLHDGIKAINDASIIKPGMQVKTEAGK